MTAHDRCLQSYPLDLRDVESEAIAKRREEAAPEGLASEKRSFLGIAYGRREIKSHWENDGIGLAISGGGIRSATFALGVLQAMAKYRFLRLVDFLSTVSGGSFIGSYLGRHYLREEEFQAHAHAHAGGQPTAAGSKPTPLSERVESLIEDSASDSVYWLRENGRYLTPSGAGDVVVAATVALRSWFSVQLFVGVFVLTVLLACHLIRFCGTWLLRTVAPAGIAPPRETISNLSQKWGSLGWYDQLTRVVGWPLLVVLSLFVIGGLIYWLVNYSWFLRLWVDEKNIRATTARARRDVTEASSFLLLAALLLVVYRVVDQAGLEIYLSRGQVLVRVVTGVGAAAAVVLGIVSRLGLTKMFTAKAARPMTVAVGAVLFAGYLSVLSAGSYWLTDVSTASTFAVVSGFRALLAFVALGLVSWLWGTRDGILNLTTMHTLYSARLARAYLGASNPKRWKATAVGVTEPLEGDDIPLTGYRPFDGGGPLHIINATLNETVSGQSQLEQRDRKGLPVAVSTLAMSVGVSHHATITSANGCASLHMTLKPAGVNPPEAFKIIPEPVAAEALPLSQWVGISGAAVCTGMGSRTSLGLSLLLGFFNVRLGYWWNSMIDPSVRNRTPYIRAKRVLHAVNRLFITLFRAQSYLLGEFLGRFYGPGRALWHLTDGGHFENTGVYELIRRQLPLIICLDNGADPNYTFADLGNLVRLARTDFGAEIRFMSINKDDLPVTHVTPLNALVDFGGRFYGNVADLEADLCTGRSKCHAAIALIHYAENPKPGILIWVKPSLTGDEACDVIQYDSQCRPFPQETTADQFFDEAQWESYRELGYHIGVKLMESFVWPGPDDQGPPAKAKAKAPKKRPRVPAKA